MNILLKSASLLLSYPTKELFDGLPELRGAIAKKGSTTAAKGLLALIDDLSKIDLYDAQERYVFLFDRTRSLSLHLFEHVHGESRDRGQAMVDLMSMYDEAGLVIDEKELPDYLPLFLEYLSTRQEADVRELLSQTLHIISAIRERLKKRKSVYTNVFSALEAISRSKPDAGLLKSLLAEPEDDPNDLEALDEIWEEEVVTFGGGSGENACGPDRIQRQVRAAARRPEGFPTAENTHKGA